MFAFGNPLQPKGKVHKAGFEGLGELSVDKPETVDNHKTAPRILPV